MESTQNKELSTVEIINQLVNSKYKLVNGRMVKVASAPVQDSEVSSKSDDSKLVKKELNRDTKDIISDLINIKIDVESQCKVYLNRVPNSRKKVIGMADIDNVKNDFWFNYDSDVFDLMVSLKRVDEIIKRQNSKYDVRKFVDLKNRLILKIKQQLLRDINNLNERIDYSFRLFETASFDQKTDYLITNDLVSYYESITYTYNTISKELDNESKTLLKQSYSMLKGKVLNYLRYKGKANECLFPTQYVKH